MTALGGPREPDPSARALTVLRRRWLGIVGVVLVCVAVALVQDAVSEDEYEASARVVFGAATLSDTALQVDRGGPDPEREAATNVLIAESPEVAAGVRRRLATDMSEDDLLDAVSVEAEENADVLLITATSETPSTATRIANAFADEYIAFKVRSDVQDIRAAEADLRRQLSGLPAGSPLRESLRDSLQRLTSLRAVATGGARVIGRADVPTSPAGLGTLPLIVLGVIVGLALGLALAFLRETMDTRLNDVDEFEREYGLPALAATPSSAFRPTSIERREAHLEPFRILRSTVDFARVSSALDVLLVTSAVPGEGKTTVAVNLAHAMALTGRQVALVELDLRRPAFGQRLEIDPRRGVTTALRREAPLADLVQTPMPHLPNLTVLPAGHLPPNPSELLAADPVAELLAELATGETMVIVDAPPLLPVADAQVLLAHGVIDNALIVARAGVTMRDEVRRTRAILDRRVRPPLGLVVTGVDTIEAYGYEAYPNQAATGEPAEAPGTSVGSPSR